MYHILPSTAVLLTWCTLSPALPAWAEPITSSNTVNFEQTVHFVDSEGRDLAVEPGLYRLATSESAALRLLREDDSSVGTVESAPLELSEPMQASMALSITDTSNSDQLHILLALTEKTARHAVGSLSGARSRATGLLPAGLGLPYDPSMQKQMSILPPDPPIVLDPTDSYAGVFFSFTWKLAQATPVGTQDDFKICVFEATSYCGSPTSVVFPPPGAPLVTGKLYQPDPAIINSKIPGRIVKWSIATCRTMLPTPTKSLTPTQPLPSMCSRFSVPRTFTWLLHAPRLLSTSSLAPPPGTTLPVPGTQGSSQTALYYRFTWGSVIGAERYFFCLYDGPPEMCTTTQSASLAANPIVLAKGGTEHVIQVDLPQFRGLKTVRWTVAACTSRLTGEASCVWDTVGLPVSIQNRLLPPVLQPAQQAANFEMRMTWTLQEVGNIRRIKVCAVRAPVPIAPDLDAKEVIKKVTDTLNAVTSGSLCEQPGKNIMLNPVRSPMTVSCLLKQPFPSIGHNTMTAFGFSVGACNEDNQCAFPQFFAVAVSIGSQVGSDARCD